MRKNIKNDNMRRLIIALMLTALAVTLCAPCVSADTSGTCGSGLTWSLALDGTLTISGNGAMKNYSEENPAPWAELSDQIRVIVIENGVASIGNYAFYGLDTVVSVTVPGSVKTIGMRAFKECVNLQMVTLAKGVEILSESAFECCEALRTIRLPNTLQRIDRKAFYRCYSLQTITIPASVTSIGNIAFAYCKGLIVADIRATIAELPYWMFYSCESLSVVTLTGTITSASGKAFYNCNQLQTVNYGGTPQAAQKLTEDIQSTSLENFSESLIHYQVTVPSGGKASNTELHEDKLVSNTTTVTTTENATVSTTVTESTELKQQGGGVVAGDKQTSVSIQATIENKDGWNELLDAIEKGKEENVDKQTIEVGVQLHDGKEIADSTLDVLAGKDVNLTIDMKDGSSVSIDCERLEVKKDKDQPTASTALTSLAYTLSINENPTRNHMKTIGDAKSYLLSFDGSSAFKFSPKIYIGKESAYQTATLYQYVPGQGLSLLQTVLVDTSGYATYYLGSTKDTTQYLIGLNVAGVDVSSAIIPEDMASEYGNMVYYESIEYVTTGVRMFMGLSFFQFTIAVICVMIALFVGVGIVMGVLYRKKKLELYYKQLKENQS